MGKAVAHLNTVLTLGAWARAGWAGVFTAAGMIYIPNFEEPGLERRFGEPYRIYKANVPRWLPRLTPWQGDDGP